MSKLSKAAARLAAARTEAVLAKEAVRELVIDAILSGGSPSMVASQAGVSRMTVYVWCRDAGVPTVKTGQ